jgi:hypothetical protein
MKHSISNAILTIQTASQFGYEGLRAFTLTREDPHILEESFDPTEETYDEFIQRLATACWMGSDYFRMWLGDENTKLDKHQVLDLNNLSNGIYYMDFQGEESHYWVWIIDGNDIWYAGTYGGICELIVRKFDKSDYFIRFIKAMHGSLIDYSYVFQIVYPEISAVKYKSLNYMRSNRY